VGVVGFQEVANSIQDSVTAYTGGTLALLSSSLGVFLPEAVKGFLLRFVLPHDGNVMLGFDVVVELIFVLGQVPNVFDCESLQGDTVFTSEGHFILGKRLWLDEAVLVIRYHHSVAS